MDYLLVFVIWIFIHLFWLYIFKKLWILDKPWPDVPKRPRVPTAQWIFLIISFLVIISLLYYDYIFKMQFLWLLIGAIVLWIVSFIDNFRNVSPKVRLIIQILISCIAFFVWWTWFFEISLPFWIELNFWIIWLIITIIWFVWFINAINWFDWIYWLASWVSSIWFLTIFCLLKFVVLPFYPDITPENLANLNMVINVSFVLFALTLITTFIEFKPFWLVRDVWTMFMGFCLAYLALMWWAKIWTILVVLSLVIFDAIWVFTNRIILMKKNPLKWDYTHLHHRLLALKWNRTEIRLFIWWWSIFLMILMILQWTNRLSKIVIFLLMFTIFFLVHIYLYWYKKMPMEYKKWNKIDNPINKTSHDIEINTK